MFWKYHTIRDLNKAVAIVIEIWISIYNLHLTYLTPKAFGKKHFLDIFDIFSYDIFRYELN